MFVNSAYEAYYTFLGAYLHSASIEIITSQGFFLGLLVLIFGICFFLTAWHYFSRFIPGAVLGKARSIALSSFFRLLVCLILGISILKVGTTTSIKTYNNVSWHTNSYIEQKLPDVQESYEVSFVFDLLTRSAEEIARFASVIVDKLFSVTNSELQAPSYFYKAIMYAGTESIEDPDLKEKISFYTNECFEKLLPSLNNYIKADKLDGFYGDSAAANQALSQITIGTGADAVSCLDLKNEVKVSLREYARKKTGRIPDGYFIRSGRRPMSEETYLNEFASQSLVNYYLDQRETMLGVQRASQVPGTAARIFQYLNRVFSWDALLSLVGQGDKQGASLSANRAQQFSEYLQRAPHLKGIVKMILMMIFPWLVFFVVGGKWKILIFWYSIYISVLLWTPIWTLSYHIITSIALSTETMAAFGRLSDGISLYSAQLITSRLYHFYAVYAWIQLFVGPLPTIVLGWQLSSILRDKEGEAAPSFINEGKGLGSKATMGG